MTEQTLDDIEVIYLGKRKTTKGDVVLSFISNESLEHMFATTTDWEKRVPSDLTERVESEASLFKPGKKVNFNSVGARYAVRGKIEGGRIVRMDVTAPRYAGTAETEAHARMTTAWKTIHDAIELQKRIETAEKNADNDPAFRNALAVLKYRYRTIPAGYRRGFQLWLLSELEKK